MLAVVAQVPNQGAQTNSVRHWKPRHHVAQVPNQGAQTNSVRQWKP